MLTMMMKVVENTNMQIQKYTNTKIKTSARVVNGVSSAGFTTQEQPAARAAATCKNIHTKTNINILHICIYIYKYKRTIENTQVKPAARAAATC